MEYKYLILPPAVAKIFSRKGLYAEIKNEIDFHNENRDEEDDPGIPLPKMSEVTDAQFMQVAKTYWHELMEKEDYAVGRDWDSDYSPKVLAIFKPKKK